MDNISALRICVEKQGKIMDFDAHDTRRRAAFIKSNIWPAHSKIRIGFYEAPPDIKWTPLSVMKGKNKPIDPLEEVVRSLSPSQAIIKVVTERIIPIVNLSISFVSNVKDANVRVNFKKDGAWAYVGNDNLNHTDYNDPTVNFEWLDVATIIHEFCHVMGMIHEHQNPFGKPIDWNVQAVYQWAQSSQKWDKETTDVNILEKYDQTLLNGSEYDPNSVMLYFFPNSLTNDHVGTEQNMRLSPTDAIWLEKMYPGGQMSASQFYKQTYNEDISEDTNETTPTTNPTTAPLITTDSESINPTNDLGYTSDDILLYAIIGITTMMVMYLVYYYITVVFKHKNTPVSPTLPSV